MNDFTKSENVESTFSFFVRFCRKMERLHFLFLMTKKHNTFVILLTYLPVEWFCVTSLGRSPIVLFCKLVEVGNIDSLLKKHKKDPYVFYEKVCTKYDIEPKPREDLIIDPM